MSECNVWEINTLKHVSKSLKIPKGKWEVVNLRTDNSMAKRKRTKRQIMINKNLHRKFYFEQHETHKKIVVDTRCYAWANGFCSTSDIRCVTVKWNEHHVVWRSCWTPVYVNTNNIHKTRTPIKHRSKDQPYIMFTLIS